jgi:hypothetical protein
MSIDDQSSSAESAPEKQVVVDTHEAENIVGVSSQPDPTEVGFDAKHTKKLLRKLDLHLVPFLALLYL